MNLKIKRPRIVLFLQGLVKDYRNRMGEQERVFTSLRGRLDEILGKGGIQGMNIFQTVKRNENLVHLLNSITKKNPVLKQYYTIEGLNQIIFYAIAKEINQQRTLNLSSQSIARIEHAIYEEIGNLQEKRFAFQVVHLHYEGPPIKLGPCEIVKLKGTKVYEPPIARLLPDEPPQYTVYIIVTVPGNDNKVDLTRARRIAESVVGTIKIAALDSPMIRVGDKYYTPYKDGWMPGYKTTRPLHWDHVAKEAREFELAKTIIEGLLTTPNDMREDAINSLIRFSNAMQIYDNSYKLCEIMGCIETLLTERSEARLARSNIAAALTKRIKALIPQVDEERLGPLVEKFYDIRSGYAHQSRNADQKEVGIAERLYGETIARYVQESSKLKSKAELINKLNG